MDEKRKQIIRTAIQLFSEKGYSCTSVQEVAQQSQISKGALYHFFESKEDLLLQILEYYHRLISYRAINVKLDSSLSAKERLQKKVVLELDMVYENRDFFFMLSETLPIYEHKNIIPVVKRIQKSLMHWHRESLLEAYGDQIQSYIWDLLIMFEGIMKEYSLYMIRDHIQLDRKKTAQFVVDRLDTIVQHSGSPEPVLTATILERYFHPWETERDKPIQQLVQQLKETVEALTLKQPKQKELLSTVTLLQEEIDQPEPRVFLIRALLEYLKKEEDLQCLLQWIERKLDARFSHGKE